jgi:hypothetical protein
MTLPFKAAHGKASLSPACRSSWLVPNLMHPGM